MSNDFAVEAARKIGDAAFAAIKHGVAFREAHAAARVAGWNEAMIHAAWVEADRVARRGGTAEDVACAAAGAACAEMAAPHD